MIAKKLLLFVFISGFLLVGANNVNAILPSGSSSPAGQIENTQNRLKNPITNLQNKNTSTPSSTAVGLKNKLEQRQTIKEMVTKKREEAIAKFKIKRDEFKAKLEQIKDAKKKIIVERIDTRMSTVNKNRTDRMSEVLDKLTAILDRLSERIATAKANGKNVAKIEAAIVTARTAIATAQTAVSTQAGKEYVIVLGEEIALKGIVGTTVSQLQSDLQATHKAVVDAKQAVQNVFREINNAVSVNKNTNISVTPPVASATAVVTQ